MGRRSNIFETTNRNRTRVVGGISTALVATGIALTTPAKSWWFDKEPDIVQSLPKTLAKQNITPPTAASLAGGYCNLTMPRLVESERTARLCDNLQQHLSPDEVTEIAALARHYHTSHQYNNNPETFARMRALLLAAAPGLTPSDAVTIFDSSGLHLSRGLTDTIYTLAKTLHLQVGTASVDVTSTRVGDRTFNTPSLIPSLPAMNIAGMACYTAPRELLRNFGYIREGDEAVVDAMCTLFDKIPSGEIATHLTQLARSLKSPQREDGIIGLQQHFVPLLNALPPEHQAAIISHIAGSTQLSPEILTTGIDVLRAMPQPAPEKTQPRFTPGTMAGLESFTTSTSYEISTR